MASIWNTPGPGCPELVGRKYGTGWWYLMVTAQLAPHAELLTRPGGRLPQDDEWFSGPVSR